MKRILFVLAALVVMAAQSMGAASYTPLRSYVTSLGPEFIIGTVGDSWTANAQKDGETADSWANVAVGSSAPYFKNSIWADPTTCLAGTWTSRLAWRLKTHQHVTEAVGGAPLATTGTTFSFKQDSSVCGWIDDLARANPRLVIGYGGINNMISTSVPTWANIRPMALGFGKTLRAAFPPTVPIIIPTLQPCGLRAFHYKKASGTNAWNVLTWTQVGDNALAIQALQVKFNTYLKDTLKKDLATAGFDTSRIWIYDQFEKLAYQSTWTAGALASTYPLTLGNGTTGLPSATQADSVKWAALRFVRREIESDSIHINHKGLRQFADSMATNVFGLDLSTWAAGTAKTIYVDKQRGNNWTNRLLSTQPQNPLATLQCAIWRAWPGDSIYVAGSGNQALIKTSTGKSVSGSELQVTKTGLRIGFAPEAYYSGVYNSGTSVGINWFDYDTVTAGDNMELPPSIASWPTNGVVGVNYPKVTLNLSLNGLRARGYQTGLRFKNVDGVTLRDCQLKGGASTNGGLSVVNYGETLTWNLTRCSFWPDSNTTATPWTGDGTGSLVFTTTTNSAGDSSIYAGTIKQCTFTGLAAKTGQSALWGYFGGMALVANTFSDPVPYQYGWLNETRNSTGATGDIKLIHNRFDTTCTSEVRIVFCTQTTASLIDSVIIVGNVVNMGGATPNAGTTLYRGPYTAARTWVDGNVVPTVAATISASGTAKAQTTLATDGAAVTNRNWQAISYYPNMAGDTIKFGGRSKYYFHSAAASTRLWYGLSAYGIQTAPVHATIGPTQITERPYVSRWTPGGRTAAAKVESPWKLLQLVSTTPILPLADSLDAATWYPILTGETPAEQAQFKTFMDAYNAWPVATRQKIRWKPE